MQQTTMLSARPAVKGMAMGLLITAIISGILSSPGWSVAIGAWITPICLLAFFRLVSIRRKMIWVIPSLMLLFLLSDYKVAPFPLPVLLLYAVVKTLELLAIYAVDRWVTKRTNRFSATLFFPAACVAVEFFNTTNGGGIWWSIANSQYSFPWLTQLASVTGMWGISFLIYWCASVVVWAAGRYLRKERPTNGLAIYGAVLASVLLFGCFRYSILSPDKCPIVRAAGISAPLNNLLETLYKDYCGHTIKIDPRASVGDPSLQKISQAESELIETADTAKFKNGFAAMNRVNDSLFTLSQAAADSGAKLICWSETNAVVFKAAERDLVEKGQRFASNNKIYLLMALCILHPGKITPGKKFMENEAVLVGPDGRVLNVFYKNNPVPMVEASVPGDGNIPVIETPYGRLSTSICYDADFPAQMRQLSRKKTGLLLLPSSDWYAISPYHTYMAVYRGLENGCSVMRNVSNGLSIATDYRGKPVGRLDYFKTGTKLWLADIPVGHVVTPYSIIGDLFAYGSLLLAGMIVLIIFVSVAIKKEQSNENLRSANPPLQG